MNILFRLAFVLCFCSMCFAADMHANTINSIAITISSKNVNTVDEIDKYCKDIDLKTKNDKKNTLYYAETGATNYKSGTWNAFKSKKEIDTACEEGCFTSAVVKIIDNVVVKVKYQFSSGSGDWIVYTDFYFRDNGTLAKAHKDHRSFNVYVYPDFILGQILTDSYFDIKGNCIYESKPLELDKKTGKTIKGAQYMSVKSPMFKLVDELPFAKLIEK